MNKWVDEIEIRLREIARMDADYQELLADCAQKRKVYESIICKLTVEEYERIEDYIASCEELEYRVTQLAYYYGAGISGAE